MGIMSIIGVLLIIVGILGLTPVLHFGLILAIILIVVGLLLIGYDRGITVRR